MRFCSSICLALSITGASALAPQLPRSRVVQTMKPHLQAVAIPLPDNSLQDFVSSSSSKSSSPQLAAPDQWVANLDYEGFGKEVTALGKELQQLNGEGDVAHLNKIVSWRNAAAAMGVLTMWMAPNPLTVLALSTWTYASWTMIAHHTCHGGYNRVNAGKFNSRGFALNTIQRRVLDWLDWMSPEAWNVEHNRLHHYRLNEGSDPDLVQRNLGFLRDGNTPMPLKYAVVAFFLPVWKWFYYAPNTFKELQIAKFKQEGKPLPNEVDLQEQATIVSFFSNDEKSKNLRQVVPARDFFAKVLAPFFVARYVVLPAPLLLIPGAGPTFFAHAMVNLILAELLTNIHAFVTIVTNHAGEDLYTFDDAVKPKTSSFYVRQIVGSANYDTGNDVTDFWHGFLNYQIEHQ